MRFLRARTLPIVQLLSVALDDFNRDFNAIPTPILRLENLFYLAIYSASDSDMHSELYPVCGNLNFRVGTT